MSGRQRLHAVRDLPKLKPIETSPLEESLSSLAALRRELGTTEHEFAAEALEEARPGIHRASQNLANDEVFGDRALRVLALVDELRRELAENEAER